MPTLADVKRAFFQTFWPGGSSSVNGATLSDLEWNYYSNPSKVASSQTTATALRSLSGVVPNLQTAARTTVPVLTLSSAVDGATPVAINANLVTTAISLNPALGMSGYDLTAAGGSFPHYNRARSKPDPIATTGSGNIESDFRCDASIISFSFQRSQLGTARVFCDGVEIFRIGPNAVQSGTAQTGASSTITLSSGASSADGYYLGQWVHIVSGTGTGQYAQIASYVGSTKIATVTPAWTTTPDNTSVYEISLTPNTWSDSTQTGYSTYFIKVDWNGERRFRTYHVECYGFSFTGVNVTSSLDSVVATLPAKVGIPTFWCGDSFSAGTGADASWSSLAAVCCGLLGWRLYNVSSGGTGFLSDSSGTAARFIDRLLPPTNSWRFFATVPTGGSFTLTQGAITTSAIQYNGTLSDVKSAVDAAFGSGAFTVYGSGASFFMLFGRGSNADIATPMTFNSSITGVNFYLWERYLGSMDPLLPRDGAGNIQPFNVVLSGVHNDTTNTDPTFTTTALQSAISTLINGLYAKYGTAITIRVVGGMYLPGGSVPAALTSADAAALTACTVNLKTINGKIPYVSTLTAGIVTGTGRLGALAGNGNSDICCWTDGVHPTPYGHQVFGTYLATQFAAIDGSV